MTWEFALRVLAVLPHYRGSPKDATTGREQQRPQAYLKIPPQKWQSIQRRVVGFFCFVKRSKNISTA